MVIGLGGVGGYVCEMLARMGVGRLILVDCDTVSESNLNRQIIALTDTVGRKKTDVMAERVTAINPECEVTSEDIFVTKDNADALIERSHADIIIDAIDNVSAKISLAVEADRAGTPLIAAMGTGNKLHPEMLEIADISKTSVCPLARVMRTELRKRGIHHLKVVYSKEEPIKGADGERIIGSVAFVPSVAGLMIAGEMIRNITECK
jgi:tRNA A37 threonylcarbamoyladenosine dehydratase